MRDCAGAWFRFDLRRRVGGFYWRGRGRRPIGPAGQHQFTRNGSGGGSNHDDVVAQTSEQFGEDTGWIAGAIVAEHSYVFHGALNDHAALTRDISQDLAET